MNEQLAKPLNDMIRGAQIQMPEQIREMVEEGLKNTRTSWDAISSSLNDAAIVQTNAAKAFGDQVMRNVTANFDATLDTVEAVTKARTLSDALTLPDATTLPFGPLICSGAVAWSVLVIGV